MSRTWEKEKLSEICSLKTGKLNSNQSVENGEYPFFTCAPETFRINKFAFDTEAVLLAGNNAAGIYPLKYYKGKFNAYQRTYVLETLDEKKLDVRFLYYALIPTLGHFQSISIGASTQYLTKSVLDNFLLPLPKVEIQNRVVEILSAYDDLIENNLKRICLLEESARLLYREWFVRFKFPNHEHTPLIDGLPEDWERKTLADLCESINYGYTASAQHDGEGVRLLRITDIVPSSIDWASVPFCEISDERKEQFLLREGDIVVARTGATVGYAKRLHKRHPESVFASYLVRLRLKEESENVLAGVFVESDEYKNYIQSQINGAAQPNANAKVLSGARLLVPTKHIQQQFREIVEPMFDQKEILLQQNQKLKQARDLLLPRLMSGEIAV